MHLILPICAVIAPPGAVLLAVRMLAAAGNRRRLARLDDSGRIASPDGTRRPLGLPR